MKSTAWVGGLLALLALPAFAIDSVFTPAGPEGPAQTVHAPPKGPGPIESMRAMDAAAKELRVPFELVVYADGQHGFNLDGPGYRRDYESDAWRRTTELLRAHLPVKAQ